MYAQDKEGPQSDLLDRRQAANYLGLAEQTLAVWLSTGRYPIPVVKVGRLVKYRRQDLDQFLKNRTMAKGQSPNRNAKSKDPRFRNKEKEAHWRDILSKWEQSGLNVRDFCKQEAMRESQFYAWRREIRIRDREQVIVSNAGKANPFVPLSVIAETVTITTEVPVEILLPGGARIILRTDASFRAVARLLAEIEKAKC